jgi:hypothetical protein
MHFINIQSALASTVNISYDQDVHSAKAGRNIRSILIAGDQVGRPGEPTPGAMSSLDIIEQHIRARFTLEHAELERLPRRPSRHLVTNALTTMTKIVKPEELFVIMFAGHGIGATSVQPAQCWSLTEGEAFSDCDLAAALRELPHSVDTVVINNCCFGEGLFEVGSHNHPSAEQRGKDSPMVSISAAGERDLVELTKLVDLAGQTVAAAAAGQSYRQLSEAFAATAVAGGTFQVGARPACRLEDRVLSPELRRRRLTPHDHDPDGTVSRRKNYRDTVDRAVSPMAHILYVTNGSPEAPGR